MISTMILSTFTNVAFYGYKNIASLNAIWAGISLNNKPLIVLAST
jgi:hypothetical protein